jgi:tellurite resistance-related uncharacterized protein
MEILLQALLVFQQLSVMAGETFLLVDGLTEVVLALHQRLLLLLELMAMALAPPQHHHRARADSKCVTGALA